MKHLTWLAALAVCGAATAGGDIAKGKEIAEQVCVACHAADGNSMIAAYPKLASQHADYLFKQTLDIKSGKRNNGSSAVMAPMVQTLSEADIRNVSAYYERQAATPAKAIDDGSVALGLKIYRSGIPEKNVPACMSCHGPAGAGTPGGGVDISAYPRLSGQHAAYLADQMKAFASGSRTSANNMMEDIAKRMNDEEIKAVSNAIQGLK